MGAPDGERERFVEAARSYWRTQGAKFTYVRKLLCGIIGESSEAFDAEMLLAWAKRTDPAIALSSVYRTLRSLCDAGLVTEFEGPNGTKMHQRSLGGSISTNHIICRNCGLVLPIDDPCLALREMEKARREGFRPEKIVLSLEAVCETFQSTGTCDRCRQPKGEE
ncbi:MAG TPA: transcriptional repressor [Bacteroidia bacterium]|nr:transcriptional repressor [Bacteroidia bacterium]